MSTWTCQTIEERETKRHKHKDHKTEGEGYMHDTNYTEDQKGKKCVGSMMFGSNILGIDHL